MVTCINVTMQPQVVQWHATGDWLFHPIFYICEVASYFLIFALSSPDEFDTSIVNVIYIIFIFPLQFIYVD